MAAEPLTITAAAPLIRSGERTPSDLLEQCLRRIDVYEPKVQAWVYLDREQARRDAERLTAEARTNYRGPLHGIPIGVKDIIDVFDMPTGCGSKRWANSYARRDATVVERLRAAGAIILGKTVTTPFAFTDPPRTRNPWKLDRTPGGSSSGSAAAVACGMCLGALGTQTGGSLTRPASYCGVYSLKATYGRVSVDGVLPLAQNLDHVGVMANCVRDLAILFEEVSGPPFRHYAEGVGVPDCVEVIDRPQGNIPRVGRLGGFFDQHLRPEVVEPYQLVTNKVNEVCQFLIERCSTPSSFSQSIPTHRTMMASDAADYHGERLRAHPDDYPPAITKLVRDGEATTGRQYAEALRIRDSLAADMRELLKGRIYFTPAAPDFAPTPETTGDPVMNSPWSLLGFPTVSMPVWFSAEGLPFALQFVGQEDYEEVLLKVVAFIEERLAPPRRLPPVPA